MIRALLALIAAVLFLILTLPVLGILFLLRKKHPVGVNRVASKMVSFIFRLIALCATVRLEIRGLENVPKDTAVLYIGNHASIFDVILTYPYLNRPAGYLAKKELRKVPILPLWMDLLGCLFLDRNDNKQALQTILTAIDHIKAGESVFIFPEGTRSKTGEMAEFKAGSFKVATRTNCPIIPVSITHTADILRKHIPFVKTTKVVITYGEAIDVASLSNEEKKYLAPMVQAKVQEMLG